MASDKPNSIGCFRQSIAWWCFADKLEPARLVKEAKAIGFSAFEIVPQEHWARILDSGLRIAAMGGHSHDGFTEGLNRRENHPRIEQELLASIQTAAEHRIPVIICLTGCRRGLSDEEGIENTAEGLRRVAKAAEEKGVTLCLELLNSKVNHPDYHCDRTWWGVEVCKRVHSPAVKLLYDIYHMQLMEGDLIRTIQPNMEHIAHFHIAGAPGRHEVDDTQEINYRGVVSAIAKTGFSGYVGHEYVPLGDPLKALRSAFKLCDV